MIYKSQKDNLFIRLHTGEVLPDALIEVSRLAEIRTAVIVSGVGMLSDVQLSYFVGDGRYDTKEYAGPLELVSLSGNISLQDDGPFVHSHASLAGPDHKLIGGHLTRGVVAVTNEIVLARVPIRVVRSLEAESGLRGITLPDG